MKYVFKVVFVVLCLTMAFGIVMSFKHGDFSTDNISLFVIRKISSIAVVLVFVFVVFFHRMRSKFFKVFSVPKVRRYSYIYFFTILFAIASEFIAFVITTSVFFKTIPYSGENFWRSHLMVRFCSLLILLLWLIYERRCLQSYAANKGFCYRLMSLILGGVTLLHHTIRRNDLAEIKSLLDKGHEIDVKDRYGQTPLHYAIEEGYTYIVKFLISKEADVNSLDKNGCTPLHYAAIDGRSKIAELLLIKGADATIREKNACIPLHYACMEGHETTAEVLITQTGNIESKDGQGCTPLCISAFRGDVSLAKLLLENGADVNAMDNQGITPLHLAAGMGHEEVAQLILSYGANVNSKDKMGDTPKDHAVRIGYLSLAKLFDQN